MRKYILLILSLLLIVVLAACGSDDAKEDKENKAEETKLVVSEEEKVAEDKVVATINNVEITGEFYNIIYVQMKGQLQQFGQDVEDLDELKERALDLLVEEELVMQDATERGITVSKEEIDTEFEAIKAEDEEQFQAFINEFSLSEDAFKRQIKSLLFHQKYFSIPEMDVTDEEAEDKYEELKDENEEIPEYDSIKDQIKVGIKQDKLQEIVNQLQEQANIEIFI